MKSLRVFAFSVLPPGSGSPRTKSGPGASLLGAPLFWNFFSKERDRLSDKGSLLPTLQERTGITAAALNGSPITTFTVEERMMWTKGREIRRKEDAAYKRIGVLRCEN